MSSQINELHVQQVDYQSLIKKVSANIKETVDRYNTEIAYNPKKAEFQEFYDSLYLDEDNPRIITKKEKDWYFKQNIGRKNIINYTACVKIIFFRPIFEVDLSRKK